MLHDVGSTLTILVVDDDQAVAELLRELLNDVPGWGATVVHDAAAARAVFHHIRVEVLVLDVNLPGISGLELLELLRRDAAWRDPPIIFISAVPDQPDVQDRVLSEGIRLIRKPFDVDELVTAVTEAVEARFGRGSAGSPSHIVR
jgi:DNA-binding response OmpR family regulator